MFAANNEINSRKAKKEQTRNLLLDAMLTQSLQVGFAGVSLRKVTAAAGISPNAFYSHFSNIDEIGDVLIRKCIDRLRERVRRVRRRAAATPRAAIEDSVLIYLKYVHENPELLAFFMRELNGSSPALRSAAIEEIRQFVQELADDIAQLPRFMHLNPDDRWMLADLVVNTLINHTLELLEIRPEQEKLKQDFIDKAIRQIRLIFIGASNWQENSITATSSDHTAIAAN